MAALVAGCGSVTRLGPDARGDTAVGSDGSVDVAVETEIDTGGPGVDGPASDVPGTVLPDALGDRAPDAASDRGPDAAIDRGPDAAVDRGADVPADLPVDRGADVPIDRPADMTTPDVPVVDANRDASCNCPRIYAPVCGVNGRTYSNMCEANCVGVAIAHAGACSPDAGDSMSCNTDADCVLYPVYVGGCCGSCRAKGEPMPARVNCIIPCQTPYTGCLCMNNKCTPQGGGTGVISR